MLVPYIEILRTKTWCSMSQYVFLRCAKVNWDHVEPSKAVLKVHFEPLGGQWKFFFPLSRCLTHVKNPNMKYSCWLVWVVWYWFGTYSCWNQIVQPQWHDCGWISSLICYLHIIIVQTCLRQFQVNLLWFYRTLTSHSSLTSFLERRTESTKIIKPPEKMMTTFQLWTTYTTYIQLWYAMIVGWYSTYFYHFLPSYTWINTTSGDGDAPQFWTSAAVEGSGPCSFRSRNEVLRKMDTPPARKATDIRMFGKIDGLWFTVSPCFNFSGFLNQKMMDLRFFKLDLLENDQKHNPGCLNSENEYYWNIRPHIFFEPVLFGAMYYIGIYWIYCVFIEGSQHQYSRRHFSWDYIVV